MEKIIVLSYGDFELLEVHQETYALLDLPLSKQASIRKIDGNYILEVGPYPNDEILALNYMVLKETFPTAVIVERGTSRLRSEKDDENIVALEGSLWVGLFGLAFVGILFMFLSSDQLKRLKDKHEKIKSKHQKLEERQHYILSTMSENIQAITKETMSHTALLAEKVKDTPLHKELSKVIHHENELLDVTDDLIKFLRLKSKKVVIQNELFNFNHVLNEVAGLLHFTHKQNNIELIFHIDKKVPKNILADSLQLGQILTNMFEYLIQNNQSNEINLTVNALPLKGNILDLQFQFDTDIVIENSESLFNSYYDEVSKRYVGLGLFVAQELTNLMQGKLLVIDRDNGKSSLQLSLPIEEQSKDKRKYRLPDKSLTAKKILIVDNSPSAANATKRLFAYFKAEVSIVSARRFVHYLPSFEEYDIVALSNSLFTAKVLSYLTPLKRAQDLKIISLDNLFSSEPIFLHDAIDLRIKKPLTQEYIFDTLIELYEAKEETIIDVYPEDEEALSPLNVYRDTIEGTANVTLDSFKVFRGKHLLIVEDNVINQKVLMSILAKSEMVIHVANNGKEAVDFMRSSNMPIEFICMDINMPVMDGYRATELIRGDQRFNQLPIVALTALISEHEIDKMFDMGATAYIPKPIRIDKLYTVLSHFLLKEEKNPIEATVIEKESLRSKPLVLKGLNVSIGLANMNGNEISYKEVLREFLDAYVESDSTFETLVTEQRFNQIKMLCFDMKGLTGSIGAKEMHTLINEIYQHIIYKKSELIEGYITQYRETFKVLESSIQRYLDS